MDQATRKRLALTAAARSERVRVECGVQIGAPVDPINIAESRGCEVRFLPLSSLEGMYSPEPRATILLGVQRSLGRRAFNCAHELAHHEFKHGVRLDNLIEQRSANEEPAQEILAHLFAGYLLMSQTSVRKALRNRGLVSQLLSPQEVYRLASFFGVGYATLVNHLTWSLGEMDQHQCESLLRTHPKEIKAHFGATPESEVVLVDTHWQGRAVDLEIGDTLVLPNGIQVEDSKLQYCGRVDGESTFLAVERGYTRAFDAPGDWAVHIRVAPKHFEGLAQFRFYEDLREEENV